MRLNFFNKKESMTPEAFSGVVRLTIEETRLSAANVESLRMELSARLAGESCAILACDRLRFIDSSGLGLLVGLRNRMLDPKLLVLEGISDPTLLELIKLTRMDQIFTLSASSKETLSLLKQL